MFLVLDEENQMCLKSIYLLGTSLGSILLLSYGTYIAFSLVRFFIAHPLLLDQAPGGLCATSKGAAINQKLYFQYAKANFDNDQ